ncbi:hypothetical protein [Micromonospora siamensis]|uniref:hypothetical protein n=1 Tax=Micromonospora siamensis TaxID=299152 RepID=UPI001E28C3B1|nr:hypothetical protein [Micromonospora siamensis]
MLRFLTGGGLVDPPHDVAVGVGLQGLEDDLVGLGQRAGGRARTAPGPAGSCTATRTAIDATANRLPGLIADLRFEVIPGGPDNIAWTHPELVNRHLLEFIGA